MSTLGSYNLTYGEIAKRLETENGKLATVVEMLSQSNEILDDAVAVEGNLDSGMRTTLRTGIPQGTWRRFYTGVQPGRSTTSQVEIRCAQVASLVQIDTDLADLAGRKAEVLASETRAHVEGLTQQVGAAMFYGNQVTSPEQISGLALHYNSTTAESGDNLIRAGGAGSDNASIWLVGWDENATTLVYPKGLKGGLTVKDCGIQRVVDATGAGGASYEAYVVDLKWNIGLAVRDWRQNVRLCNIDVSNAEGGTDPGFNTYLQEMLERVQDLNKGRFAFYMNRTMRRLLSRYTRADIKAGGGMTHETVQGKRVTMFDGIPIRTCDQLLNTESTVS